MTAWPVDQSLPFAAPPDVVAHADWSVDPAKRWLARATRDGDRYRLHAPLPVGPAPLLPRRLTASADTVLLGVDFPLGLPAAYAARAGVAAFLDVLPRFGVAAPWEAFYAVAEEAADISLYRPFYPRRPGGRRLAHLVERLGLASADALYRRCDRPTADRPAAAPLFWTMGAKQVGKAAIHGWSHLLAPALFARTPTVHLWPFDARSVIETGPLCVIAEAYPAEYAARLGVAGSGSKRDPAARRRAGAALLAWSAARPIVLSAALRAAIQSGFGPGARGEDPFDAVVGLCGMLETLISGRPALPADLPPGVTAIEGWIFGRPLSDTDHGVETR